MKELLVLENDTYILEPETSKNIAEFEKQIKALKTKEDELKAALLSEMRNKGIKSVKDEINGVTITYIAPTDRETFDSKAFREQNKDLYDSYVSFTPVKDSVRISVK